MNAVSKYGFMEVHDGASKVAAEEALAEIRRLCQKYDGQRKEWCAPLYNTQSLMNSAVKSALEPAQTVELSLKSQLSNYLARLQREESQRRAEAERLAREEAEKAVASGEVPDIPEAVAPYVEPQPVPASGKVTYRDQVRFVVEDTSKVPADYWRVDEALIAKAVTSGLRDIPGVRIWTEQVPVMKREQ